MNKHQISILSKIGTVKHVMAAQHIETFFQTTSKTLSKNVSSLALRPKKIKKNNKDYFLV